MGDEAMEETPDDDSGANSASNTSLATWAMSIGKRCQEELSKDEGLSVVDQTRVVTLMQCLAVQLLAKGGAA